MTTSIDIDGQMHDAESIQQKISSCMELLRTKQINNLILREGYSIEGEMVMNGDVVIAECHTAHEHNTDTGVLTRNELKAMAYLVANDWEQRIHQGGIDGIYTGGDGSRYRVNIYLWGGRPTDINDSITGRLGCMIRVIPPDIPNLASLNLPPYMRILADANYGLMLVCGPTGAGKSTTSASYIDHINHTRSGHIIKVEDPIELNHKEDKCRISPREIGTNVISFEVGVRDALRELPIAIAVGEIRNQETLVQTMRAAHSGHYVTATVHAPNLVSAVRSLVDDMPGDSKANAITVSETLLGVIFQVCVPGLDDNWNYVHEVMNVTNNERAKECIATQNWPGLKDCFKAPSKPTEQRMACSLNENLSYLVHSGKVSAVAADRKAYDRPGLAANIAERRLVEKTAGNTPVAIRA
jgi:twitching motility protein PilT